MREELNRGTGLLWIEVINSNPNGDPDRDSDPRQRSDGRGEISPVSIKHKIREIVADKGGPLWQEFSKDLGITADEVGNYDILERSDTDRNEVKDLSVDDFLDRFWDARVFGSTFLEKNDKKKNDEPTFIHTGVVQFGMGVSLSPIEVERLTTTKALPVESDKTKGMAPLAYRIVQYGLYTMPFFVNATVARRTKCTKRDIDLFLKVLPFAYQESASYVRPQVHIRRAYYAEHARPRGCFNDFDIIEALTPVPHGNEPAHSLKDYDLEKVEERKQQLNDQMKGKAGPIKDIAQK